MNMDLQSLTNEISYYGESITLTIVTDASYSKWGSPTETTTTETKTAVVQILSQEDQLVKDGIFQSGDKSFWFKGDETNITRGNRITHASLIYEIVSVEPHYVAGTIYLIEVKTKKV